ncbi:hypothetical protein HGRIS_000474 [Hohenbuehelia grisea]|uniref:Uncharacterized protein n=1 Tax=Hohenbuehelia grisea TaxID=104357 RepID=A0ABR3JRT1_9AGAR
MQVLGLEEEVLEGLLAMLQSLAKTVFGPSTYIDQNTPKRFWEQFFERAVVSFPGAKDPEKAKVIRRYITKVTQRRHQHWRAGYPKGRELKQQPTTPSSTSDQMPIAIPSGGVNGSEGQNLEPLSFEECALQGDILTTHASSTTDSRVRVSLIAISPPIQSPKMNNDLHSSIFLLELDMFAVLSSLLPHRVVFLRVYMVIGPFFSQYKDWNHNRVTKSAFSQHKDWDRN